MCNPYATRLMSHIGFDMEKGFDLKNIPPEWKHLFEKAGVTEEHLRNQKTTEFIMDFVENRGGPPPVPPRTSKIVIEESSPRAQLPLVPTRRSGVSPSKSSSTIAVQSPSSPSNHVEGIKRNTSTVALNLMESIRNSGGVSSLKKVALSLFYFIIN